LQVWWTLPGEFGQLPGNMPDTGDAELSRPPFKIHQLGEIAICCADMDAMFEFYRDIVGLDVLSDTRDTGIAFFRICTGFGGHTSVLALFHNSAGRPDLHPSGSVAPETGAKSSLHHLALTVAFAEQEAIIKWLDDNAIDYKVQVFDWIGWQGIFMQDPEGNTVEFVAADKSLLAGS
jgi:catechol 2,3-dioxygenase-like lactoylglutathione lyase family enzyme